MNIVEIADQQVHNMRACTVEGMYQYMVLLPNTDSDTYQSIQSTGQIRVCKINSWTGVQALRVFQIDNYRSVTLTR